MITEPGLFWDEQATIQMEAFSCKKRAVDYRLSSVVGPATNLTILHIRRLRHNH